MKVATNTTMYERMIDDMDLNAGTVLEGESVKSAGKHIFELILEVAGGAKTKSEVVGVGEEEFAPWQIGPVFERQNTHYGQSAEFDISGVGRRGDVRILSSSSSSWRGWVGSSRSLCRMQATPASVTGSFWREPSPR